MGTDFLLQTIENGFKYEQPFYSIFKAMGAWASVELNEVVTSASVVKPNGEVLYHKDAEETFRAY